MQRLINFEGTPAVFHESTQHDRPFRVQPTTPTQLLDRGYVALTPEIHLPVPSTPAQGELLPQTVEHIIDMAMTYVDRARVALTRNLLAPPAETIILANTLTELTTILGLLHGLRTTVARHAPSDLTVPGSVYEGTNEWMRCFRGSDDSYLEHTLFLADSRTSSASSHVSSLPRWPCTQ